MIQSHKQQRYGVDDQSSIPMKEGICLVTLISRSATESFR
jgi:hypothetical protein